MAEEMNQTETGMPQNNQYVAFNLRDEEYGVSILNVQEIRNLTDITRVPFAADFIKGVINLRGSVLPVIDLKQRLGLAETPYTDRTRIVTVSVDDVHVGMLVDAVTEVLSLENEPVDTKKATNARESSRFLSGIVLLNLEEIVGLPKEVK